jgi:hypothetical protein
MSNPDLVMQNEHIENGVILSTEKIIDIVRTVRNNVIKDMLKDDSYESYFNRQFSKPLSTVKKEFIKRELKELLIYPIDLVHYSKLINKIKETNSTLVTDPDQKLIYDELDGIFKKYTF